MSLADRLRADRRLVVLQALAEDSTYTLNDTSIGSVLRHLSHTVPRDLLRADLSWLAEQALLRLERRPDGAGGEVWIASLTHDGSEVAAGRSWPGIARPGPR